MSKDNLKFLKRGSIKQFFLFVLFLVGILFIPIPYQKKFSVCEPWISSCNYTKWYFGPSLWQNFINQKNSGNNVIQSSTNTPEPRPTSLMINSNAPDGFIQISELNEWKTYSSKKIGYSIIIPPQWSGYINENDSALNKLDYDRDYLTSLLVFPKQDDMVCKDGVTIDYPYTIKGPHKKEGKIYEQGLNGLEQHYQGEASNFDEQHITYSTIGIYRSLVISQTQSRPPRDFKGEWCPTVSKTLYVDLANGEILKVSGFRDIDSKTSDFDGTFEKMINSLSITN